MWTKVYRKGEPQGEVFKFKEEDAHSVYLIQPQRGAHVNITAPIGECPALEECAMAFNDDVVTVEIYVGDKMIRLFDGKVDRFLIDEQAVNGPEDRLFIGVWKPE